MNDYIFKDGDWMPCGDLMGWDYSSEDWEVVAERIGLQAESSHKIGHPYGLHVEAYSRIRGRVFEPNNDITHLITVTTSDDTTNYYCPGHHVMHKKLAELSIPSVSEYVSIGLTDIERKRQAIEVEEVEDNPDTEVKI